MPEITDLLVRASKGDAHALDDLMPRVYDDLRGMARAYMRKESDGHTLTPTALVHEAYVRLADQHHLICHNRWEFFALTASFMRRILADHARRRLAEKRGGGQVTVTLEGNVGRPVTLDELITIDEALTALGSRNPRLPLVVDLMVFGGLTHAEIATGLQISVATVKRDWQVARAWLIRRLENVF